MDGSHNIEFNPMDLSTLINWLRRATIDTIPLIEVFQEMGLTGAIVTVNPYSDVMERFILTYGIEDAVETVDNLNPGNREENSYKLFHALHDSNTYRATLLINE